MASTSSSEQRGQKQLVTLSYVFVPNFGSNCPILKIQLLACSEFLHAAIFCGHVAEFAIRKNKTIYSNHSTSPIPFSCVSDWYNIQHIYTGAHSTIINRSGTTWYEQPGWANLYGTTGKTTEVQVTTSIKGNQGCVIAIVQY